MKKNILEYWRNSLADAERPNPTLTQLEALSLSLDMIKKGEVPKNYIDDNFKYVFNPSENISIGKINILLAPIVLRLKEEHGVSKKTFSFTELIPLWIPVYLTKDGLLQADNETKPWISRVYLEPCNNDISIAKLNHVDEYFTKHPCNPGGWSEYWDYCLSFFKTVANCHLLEFQHSSFIADDNAYIALNPNNKGMTKHIIGLYDNIIKFNPICELLNNITNLANYNKLPLLDEDSFINHSLNHCGQMGNFALADSQRETLYHFFNISAGETLAVNGPPGTGKTTLLQSVIASLWVKAAYKKLEPPIIVATSTNNQAITNIINSFSVSDTQNILHKRWIDFVKSYGIYLNSDSNKNSQNWQTISPSQLKAGSQSFGLCNDLEQLNLIENNFLASCSAWAKNTSFTFMEKAINYLHNALIQVVDEANLIITSFYNYQKINREQTKNYSDGIEKEITKNIDILQDVKLELENIKKLEIEWNEYLFKKPFWIDMLSSIPFIKKYANKKAQLWGNIFFIKYIHKEITIEEFTKNLYSKKQNLTNETYHIEEILEKLNFDKQELELITQKWNNYKEKLNVNSQNELFAKLDVEYRYKSFAIATHYWEARWIIQSREDLDIKDNLSTKKLMMRWLRIAKLSPCFVATFHMLPKFFTAYDDGKTPAPLYNFIDLLIVDEAGQVSPEIAGSSFSLAKTALIVGDTKQIEPVWNIDKQVDIYNLQKFKITDSFEDAVQLLENKIWISNGSLMAIGQKVSKHDKIGEGGMYLNVHRRCVKEIISFCNELAYNGTLEIKRESLKNYPLPHMGYAHINGHTKKNGSSRYNDDEAQVIVKWIHSNQSKLCEIYPSTDLKNIIAIITPFKAQIGKIRSHLRAANLADITVGTVHSLQGAERPIIIFSSVYTHGSTINFLDNLNLLNVTISRAKDSFLVFGDMSIYNPNKNTPTGKLAKYLFAHEENEIKNIEVPISLKFNKAYPALLLRGAEQHDNQLNECIKISQYELHIVSPFLSANAIKSNILLWLKNAIERKVKVFVYTDKDLNNKNIENYNEGIKLLEGINVTVYILNRIHNKSLWIDDRVLIEGSFNWLSARRDTTNQWCRYETSLVYSGSNVNQLIDTIHNDLKRFKINKIVERI